MANSIRALAAPLGAEIACTTPIAPTHADAGVSSTDAANRPANEEALRESRSRRAVWTVIACFLGGHLVSSLIEIAELVSSNRANLLEGPQFLGQLARVLVAQALMLGAFFLVLRMRRSARATQAHLEEALRAVAQRDALLTEAARERDDARLVGVPGRYTDQAIGDYNLGNIIGRGAMGVVYEATRRSDFRPAAVKVMHAHVLAEPEHFRRFVRELKVTKSIQDPHVVRVFDVPAADDLFPYMAMERLRGASLYDYLNECHSMDEGDVLELVEQLGAGLAAAHAEGVVHRDLKPKNVFRLEDSRNGVRWKILDFGTCKLEDDDPTLTERGRVIGTPAYMAPEQVRGAQVDYRCDLYALAIVAYRALTGHPPFCHLELPRLLHDIVYNMPPRPSDVSALHRDVDRVFAVALAKRPCDRFDSSKGFRDALAAALSGTLSPDLREAGRRLEKEQPWALGVA